MEVGTFVVFDMLFVNRLSEICLFLSMACIVLAMVVARVAVA